MNLSISLPLVKTRETEFLVPPSGIEPDPRSYLDEGFIRARALHEPWRVILL